MQPCRNGSAPLAPLLRYSSEMPCQRILPTPADNADTLRELQEKLADVTTRVKVLEEILTTWPQFAGTPPTAADTSADRSADTAPAGRGQRKLTPRQQRALRDKYQRGVSVPALMDEYGMSRASVFRYLQSEKR
jgi:hypothetical protein